MVSLRLAIISLILLVASITVSNHDVTASHAKTSQSDHARFIDIAVGPDHVCGILIDHTVRCWGRNDSGQANSPQGAFRFITTSRHNSCGITTENETICWGRDVHTFQTSETYASIGLGNDFICGLKTDGSVECWDRTTEYTVHSTLEFSDISIGHRHGCGIRVDRTVQCWGINIHGQAINNHGQANPPPGQFDQISAGVDQTCGLKIDGKISCWGVPWHGRLDAPTGSFSFVATQWDHSCAISADGSIVCWGNDHLDATLPPQGTFQSIGVGAHFGCGIRQQDDVVVCWGVLESPFAVPELTEMPAPPTTNIEVRDGDQAGEVVVSWDAVPEATYYRIGHINLTTDYPLAKASTTGEWRAAFLFSDVNAKNFTVEDGRAQHTIRRLERGSVYAFTVHTTSDANYDLTYGGQFRWPCLPCWAYHTIP